jgi:hypothetical protein
MRSEKFKRKTDWFIETGTYIGLGVDLALQSGFDKVYSIELITHYFNACVEKFKSNSRVELIQGDSYYKLGELLNRFQNTPFTYWLDGHYSGGDTGFGVEETPLIQELEVILSRNVDGELIYVDDMRLYRNMNNNVNSEKIKELLMKYKPNCKIWYESTQFDSQDILCIEY